MRLLTLTNKTQAHKYVFNMYREREYLFSLFWFLIFLFFFFLFVEMRCVARRANVNALDVKMKWMETGTMYKHAHAHLFQITDYVLATRLSPFSCMIVSCCIRAHSNFTTQSMRDSRTQTRFIIFILSNADRYSLCLRSMARTISITDDRLHSLHSLEFIVSFHIFSVWNCDAPLFSAVWVLVYRFIERNAVYSCRWMNGKCVLMYTWIFSLAQNSLILVCMSQYLNKENKCILLLFIANNMYALMMVMSMICCPNRRTHRRYIDIYIDFVERLWHGWHHVDMKLFEWE